MDDAARALGWVHNNVASTGTLRRPVFLVGHSAGAHISALLMTFFFSQMKQLVDAGHLYLAVPPLYRLSQGGKSQYAIDEIEKEHLLKNGFKSQSKIDVSRFKGLGEMNPHQLKQTTMDPLTRKLIQVLIPGNDLVMTTELIDRLMGKNPEMRFQFITENAKFAEELDL